MPRRFLSLVLVTGLSAGCDGGVFLGFGPTAPTATNSIVGRVTDDRGYLTDAPDFIGPSAGEPIPGVRIELLDGPQAGASAVTDDQGGFSLTGLNGGETQGFRMRMSKDGWTSSEVNVFPISSSAPPKEFQLGQPPHTVWGQVLEASASPLRYLPGVRVEVVGGSAEVGLSTVTDANGVFRLEGQAPSDQLLLRFSADGYRTNTIGYAVSRNTRIRAWLMATQ